jgi:hypothetical protein
VFATDASLTLHLKATSSDKCPFHMCQWTYSGRQNHPIPTPT